MVIDIPKLTPLGRPIKTLGIWMSGGADSSLLCYLLAEKIISEQLDITIQPITIDYKRPFARKAVYVRQMIEQVLGAKDIFLKHLVYHPEDNKYWTRDELAEQFHIRNYENFKADKFQVLYSGITTNPPLDVQRNFKWGILPDVEEKRGEGVTKETVRYFQKEDKEFFEIKPFFNVNKKVIAQLYKDRKILSNIFPLTRSCEKIDTSDGHCGECWWCEERLWAFETL